MRRWKDAKFENHYISKPWAYQSEATLRISLGPFMYFVWCGCSDVILYWGFSQIFRLETELKAWSRKYNSGFGDTSWWKDAKFFIAEQL